MKTVRFLPVLLLPLLLSCVPKKYEIPMTEVPAAPLVQTLERRARSFQTLRALASVSVARKDRRRTFESVAVLVDRAEQLKLEAYGPLGQSVATVLWQGKDVLVDMNGDRRSVPPEGPGLERVLGAEVAPPELCAILSGNVPDMLAPPKATLRCAADHSCVLELKQEKRSFRVYPAAGWEQGAAGIPGFDAFVNGKLIYRVRYAGFQPAAGYELPRRIVVDSPAKQVSLAVDYAEAEVNIPLAPGLFAMPGEQEGM